LTNSVPDYEALHKAIFALKNQTVYTRVRPYINDKITKEEHKAMHSTRPNSDADYPHSFVNAPIHEIPNDYESKIVGVTGAAFAWDFALRFLLPDNVEGKACHVEFELNQRYLRNNDSSRLLFVLPTFPPLSGIIVEILNSCNQSHLYELQGIDAFYLGANAVRDPKYDDMAVVRDLFATTHPNYTSASGHCRYSIVSNTIIHF
jgi:hypothetical protein